MRRIEFKFRAWMNSDYPIIHQRNTMLSNEDMHIDNCIEAQEHGNVVVMQFTGLKDCNGVDIYEGDILKTASVTDKPMVVKWSKRFASFCLTREDWMLKHFFGEAVYPDECEVIGNIYQHPHLLNAPSIEAASFAEERGKDRAESE